MLWDSLCIRTSLKLFCWLTHYLMYFILIITCKHIYHIHLWYFFMNSKVEYLWESQYFFNWVESMMRIWSRWCGTRYWLQPACKFNSYPASGEFWRPLMTFANNLDPDEAPQCGASSEIQIVWHSDYISAKIMGGNDDFFLNFERNKYTQLQKKVCTF